MRLLLRKSRRKSKQRIVYARIAATETEERIRVYCDIIEDEKVLNPRPDMPIDVAF